METRPVIRRRWFQFSLQGFLVAVSVGCIWLGWNVEKARRQRAAVLGIREAGGAVYYDYQLEYHDFAYEGRTVTLPTANKDAVAPWPLFRQFVGDDFLYKACDVRVLNPDVRKPVLSTTALS